MAAVPEDIALFVLLGNLLFFSIVTVGSVIAAELPRGEVSAPHKPQGISSRPLL